MAMMGSRGLRRFWRRLFLSHDSLRFRLRLDGRLGYALGFRCHDVFVRRFEIVADRADMRSTGLA